MDAYEMIKKAIIKGVYKSGSRLKEENLAKDLNLSRTPIREAIRRLETEGLIIPLKRGVMVREYTMNDIKQIYDLRALLEGYAATQASIKRDMSDLKIMDEANQKYKAILNHFQFKDSEKINEIMAVNNQFHKAILGAAKNTHLNFHISNVTVLPLVFRSFYWYNEHELRRSLELHEIIYSAIVNQDPERAKSAMLEHIYQGRDTVLEHISHNEFFESEEVAYD
jgi:DNA-binding GntR family transcriptional regulator